MRRYVVVEGGLSNLANRKLEERYIHREFANSDNVRHPIRQQKTTNTNKNRSRGKKTTNKGNSNGNTSSGGGGSGDDGGGDDDGDGDAHYPAIIFNGPVTINFYPSETPLQPAQGWWHNLISWLLNFLWDIFINILANIAATYLISFVLSLWAST